MYCDLWLQYIQVRKLFKGGNYLRKYGIIFDENVFKRQLKTAFEHLKFIYFEKATKI